MTWREKWYAAHDRYELVKARLKKRLPTTGHVENSAIFRFFGSTLLRRDLWSFKPEPLARGLGLGLFVSVSPTMGFQWVVAALLVLIIPGNLPIALAACLLTNPLTTPAVLYAEYKIGEWILTFMGSAPLPPFTMDINMSNIREIVSDLGLAIVVGSLVLGVVLGVGGYFGVRGFVAVERRIKHSKLLHKRKTRKPE
ncbi:MAG: DUF2062 domain-containing protein [Nitrospinae bacterium]|nr:DUF2062 domain-containing protein [Nitrospinota bacterium]